jgi:protocatechuate 3,4-dioxygenase beta subunit
VLRSIFDEASGTDGTADRRTVAASNGQFAFNNVTPGSYEILARVTQRGSVSQELWGTANVTVAGDHVPTSTITLQPTLTLSGRVAFEGESGPRPDASQIRMVLESQSSAGYHIAAIAPSGDFTIGGFIPGRHRLTASVSRARSGSNWALKSAVINGGDALDAPLDLRSSGGAALVTFTDRIATLSGSVQDGAGRPAPEQFVIVFSTDPRFWFPMSRRVRAVRPTSDGRYEFDNLAPGEYFITTTSNVDDGEWYDHRWLQRYAGSAARIPIVEGEKQVRDFRTE